LVVPNYISIAGTGNFFENGYCATSCPETSNSTVDCAAPVYNGACTADYLLVLAAGQGYASSNILNYCIPSGDSIATSSETAANGSWFLSLYETRWVILTCIGFSLVIAFMYLKLMDCFAVPLAYITIIVIQVALVLMGYYAYEYSKASGGSSSTWAMWIAAICWTVASLFYLMIACNWKSLRVSIAVIETAAEFFSDTKRIVLIPLIYFSVWVGVFIFWIWGLAGVASISTSGVVATSVSL
jgi:Plasma-membrane choline transporter